MSIREADEGPTADSWTELEQQRVEYQTLVPPGRQNGDENQFFGGTGVDLQIAGGLERNEMAELVGYHVRGHYIVHRSSTNNLPNTLGDDVPVGAVGEFEGSINTSLTPKTVADRQDDNGLDVDIAEATGPTAFVRQETGMQFGAQDDTDGRGGGGAGNIGEPGGGMVNLRREFGRGPIADENDSLHYDCNLKLHGASGDVAFEQSFLVDHYWDVFEIDELPYETV